LNDFGTIEAIGTTAAGEKLREIGPRMFRRSLNLVFRAFRRREFSAIPAGNIEDRDCFYLYAIVKLDMGPFACFVLRLRIGLLYSTSLRLRSASPVFRGGDRAVVVHVLSRQRKDPPRKGIAYGAFQDKYMVFEFERDDKRR